MKLLVALEHHFVKCPQGVFTDLAFAYDYWQEYLEIFDSVMVVARVEEMSEKPEGLKRADGEGVEFFPIFNYQGGSSFIKNFPKIFKQASEATKKASHYLLRAGMVGAIVWLRLIMKHKQYAMECMGHVQEGLSTERPKTVFYKIVSSLTHAICKLQIHFAQCSSYTSEFLRRTYPCKKRNIEFVFSGVRLTDDVITSARTKIFFKNKPFKFLSIGRVELQKGHAWLVNAAIELAKQKGLPPWTLDIVGPGSQIAALTERVEKFGLADRVRIVGGVPFGEELFSYIDKSHLFILPSLTESMPRALIEGMARGIPAIASNTGGIPELLSDEDLVEVGDISGLAKKMVKCMTEPSRLTLMSARNFERAQDFKVEISKARKLAFWRYIYENA